MSSEDGILDSIAVEQLLERLHDADATMLRLIYRLTVPPEDWTGKWPPTFEAIGEYVGKKYEGRPLSEAAIRYRRAKAEAFLRGDGAPLRRFDRNDDLFIESLEELADFSAKLDEDTGELA